MRLWLVCGLAGAVSVIVASTPALAQGRPDGTEASPQKPVAALPTLVTDRPDFTESSDVVGKGLVQLEIGTTFESDRVAGTSRRTVTLPLALVRVGLDSRLEFRLSSAGLAVDSVRSGGVSSQHAGASDVELGVKLLILNSAVSGFAVAAIPMLSLPSGSIGQSSGGYDSTLKLTWAKTLKAGFSVSGNFNFSRLTDDAGTFLQRAMSVSIARDIAGDWGAYWEVFGFTPPERGERTAWTCVVSARALRSETRSGVVLRATRPKNDTRCRFVTR